MVLSAGIRRLLGFLIFLLMSASSFRWKFDFMLFLNLMYRIRSNMSSSKGISSLILGGEFFDLNPYVSFADVFAD